jgi:hypothetical protein
VRKLFYLIFSLLFLSLPSKVISQEGKTQKVTQFSGKVLSAENERPLSYTTIRIKNTYRGTIAGNDGFFSIPVHELDTIEFSSIGFKSEEVIIPQNTLGGYTIIQYLHKDTVTLEEAVVYPWPTPEQFKEAFMSLNVRDDLMERARKNLDQQILASISSGMAMSGRENQRHSMQEFANSYYYAGYQTQYTELGGLKIPGSFTNPFAWARFLQALKNGDFKNKDD